MQPNRHHQDRFLNMKIKLFTKPYSKVLFNIINTFEEHHNTFHNSNSKYIQIWYQTLLDQFQLLTEASNAEIESSLPKILDIQLELEIKCQEIKKDKKSIYKKTDLQNFGISE